MGPKVIGFFFILLLLLPRVPYPWWHPTPTPESMALTSTMNCLDFSDWMRTGTDANSHFTQSNTCCALEWNGTLREVRLSLMFLTNDTSLQTPRRFSAVCMWLAPANPPPPEPLESAFTCLLSMIEPVSDLMN